MCFEDPRSKVEVISKEDELYGKKSEKEESRLAKRCGEGDFMELTVPKMRQEGGAGDQMVLFYLVFLYVCLFGWLVWFFLVRKS